MQGMWVWSLLQELRYPTCLMAKTQKQYCNKFNKDFKNGPDRPPLKKLKSYKDAHLLISRMKTWFILIKCWSLSHVWLFATLWTVAHQAALFMEFSRLKTGVGCHSLLEGIIPTQGLNPGLLHCRQILYHLSHQGSPVLSLSRDNWVPRLCI